MLTTLVIAILPSLPSFQTAPDWGARLSGADRSAARTELVALGKKAGPLLTEVIENGDDDAAWQAVTLFAQLGKETKGETSRLKKLLENEDLAAQRRALVALALGGTGYKNKPGLKPLAAMLATRTDPQLSLALRVALSNFGTNAAKPALALMEEEEVVVRQCGAQVLYAINENALGVKKGLFEHLEDIESFRILPIVKLTLERLSTIKRGGPKVKKELDKIWSKRAGTFKKRNLGLYLRGPVRALSVEDVMNSIRTKSAFRMKSSPFRTELIPETSSMALPARFTDCNGDSSFTVGDVMLQWACHLATEIDSLRHEVYGAEPPAEYADWRKLVLPIELSQEGLERLYPAKAAKKK